MLERLDPDPEFWEGTGARFDDSPKAWEVGWESWEFMDSDGLELRDVGLRNLGMRLAGFSKATFTTTK